jgi:hypothetical protein
LAGPIPLSYLDDNFSAIVGGTLQITAPNLLGNTRLSKTANYTLSPADAGFTIDLGGNAFFTLTVSAALNYPAQAMFLIINSDSYPGGRGKTVSINGLSNFILWPGQGFVLFNNANAWRVLPQSIWLGGSSFMRWMVPTTVTLNVDPVNGNDANDGLATGAGNALATIAKATSILRNQFDLQNASVPIIQVVSPATITESILVAGPLLDNVQFIIQGDTATPANCLWNVAAGTTAVQGRDYGTVTVKGFKFIGLGAGATALSCAQSSVIDFTNCDFGAFAGGTHMSVQQGGTINSLGPYTISGGATAHMAVTLGGVYNMQGSVTILMPNAITMTSAFFTGTGGFISTGGSITFSGAGSGAGTTGLQWSMIANSVLFKSGNTIPGGSAGVTATGGQVI